jgi:hypothetical protein
MDPEFQKILFRVVAIGGVIGIVGTVTLVLAFRSFDKRNLRAVLLVAALLAFVLAVCGGLLMMSTARRG